jgi:hypothetical protein
MMDHKLLDILNGKLQDQVQQLVEVVSAGGAKSHEHYKELCGTIRTDGNC